MGMSTQQRLAPIPWEIGIARDPAARWFTVTFRPRARRDFGLDRAAAIADCRSRGALLYASVGVADTTVHVNLDWAEANLA